MELLMGKVKLLFWLDRIVSLTMAFAMGIVVGTANKDVPVIYLALLIGICAIAKVELYHIGRKLKKAQ